AGAFDLDDDEELVIGLAHLGGVVAGSVVVMRQGERNAALSRRRISDERHDPSGLVGIVDHRHHDAHRARVEHRRDEVIFRRRYHILPDMPAPPAPYLNPQTLQPMGPADLAPIFPQAIIAQEVSAEPWIEIPDEVRDVYRIWRPSPVYRADRLEKALDTPAHI